MPKQTVCPSCGQSYFITDEQIPHYVGRTIPCTRCGKPFDVTFTEAAPATVGYSSADVTGASRASGMAIAALVLGCLGLFVPLIGIVAIVLGIVALVKKTTPPLRGQGLAIAGISTGAVGIVTSLFIGACIAGIFMPSLGRSRETANRVKCASNLRAIGQTMMLYANDNKGVYPDSFEDLLRSGEITSDMFICPSSNDQRARGGTIDEIIADFRTPGHNSYTYCGKGLTNSSAIETVLAYEVSTNHGGDGGNFLFGDGHVEFLAKGEAQAMINELNAGHNPPRAAALKAGAKQ